MKNKTGFIYIWYDRKLSRFYVGCHWGFEDDGYVCSSSWMKKAYKNRPQDFKRRILKKDIKTRQEMFLEEERWLSMIKTSEIKPVNNHPRYYNLNIKNNEVWHKYDESIKEVGKKISAAKKGKKTGPRPESVGKAISEAKKRKFAERGGMSDEHRAALSGIKKKPHTDEWKAENSKRMKEQWTLNTTRRQAVSEAAKKRWEDYRNKKQEQLAG